MPIYAYGSLVAPFQGIQKASHFTLSSFHIPSPVRYREGPLDKATFPGDTDLQTGQGGTGEPIIGK